MNKYIWDFSNILPSPNPHPPFYFLNDRDTICCCITKHKTLCLLDMNASRHGKATTHGRERRDVCAHGAEMGMVAVVTVVVVVMLMFMTVCVHMSMR